ncbi:MAG TPA: protein kinase [Anaerolineales bacterium]|nr:protein kinase [Anaerolineales bacterium]
MADWAGKTLGKIHIDQLIARGGMAEVYVGTHESYGQVAVKILRGLLERDTDHLARFKRESEVIGELKHPYIVQMLDYYVVDETPCLVMEYVSGPTLATYLKVLRDRKQRLPIGVIAKLLASLASALDYAHEKGIVHRDIKPANVLLRSPSQDIQTQKTLPIDIQPILTDFGLVRLLDSTMHTTAGSVAGTPAYMSPEQARGEKVDKRTDLYSLGIMLYEMLSGSVPFQADTTFGMLMQHINEHPAPIPGISQDLQALLDRALAKDPALRYQSAGELANEFLAIFNGQTVSPGTLHIAQLAREAAASAQAPKPQPEENRRSRWIRMAVEFVIVVAIGAGLLLVFNPNRETPLDPNISVGRMRFRDFGFFNDRVEITLNDIPQPNEGMHYEAWLIGSDDAVRDIGSMISGASGVWRLEYNDPNAENLLRNFNQVQITMEQDDSSVATPSGEVVYSSVFPPEALVPVRNLVVSYSELPDQGPLLQNLWYYNADYINVSINNDGTIAVDQGLVEALENDDEAAFRKRTEEIINMIVGDQSAQYLDYDNDGVQSLSDSDGYGSLPNGDRLGYIQETILHAQNAAAAADATPTIRTNSQNIQTCLQNVEGWTNQILELALQLNEIPFGPEMEPIVSELSTLGTILLAGTDADGNGSIRPLEGECGATAAYEYGWDMVDMLIFPGPNRTPPPE